MPGSLRYALLVAATASSLIISSCGGGSGGTSSSSTTSTPSSTSPGVSTSPGASTSSGTTAPSQQGVALSSPAAHAALVSAISRSPNIPPAQDDRIASCAIAKLEAQHYTTVGQVPTAAATEVGRSCAEQVIGGIDSPLTHQVLLARIRRIPNVNPGQANKITDCVIARFRSHGYTSIATVPPPVATTAGQDCARQVVGH